MSIAGALFAGVVEKERYLEETVHRIRAEARTFIEIAQHMFGRAQQLSRRVDRLTEQYDAFRTSTYAYTATDPSAQDVINRIWSNHYGNVDANELEDGELLHGTLGDYSVLHPRNPPRRTRSRSPAVSPSPIPIPDPAVVVTPSSPTASSPPPRSTPSPPGSFQGAARRSSSPPSFRVFRPEPYPQRRGTRGSIYHTPRGADGRFTRPLARPTSED